MCFSMDDYIEGWQQLVSQILFVAAFGVLLFRAKPEITIRRKTPRSERVHG